MKLIDILAKELDRWPEYGDAIVQDDDSYVVAFELGSEIKCVNGDWKISSCDPFCKMTLAEDASTAIVTRTQWQTAVDTLKPEKDGIMNIDWSKLGKPPEGATHYQPENKMLRAAWIKTDGGYYWFMIEHQANWVRFTGPVVHLGTLIPIPVEWTGSGLPPVGTVCELAESVLLADAETSDWFDAGTQVEVGGYANFVGSTGPVCAVCVVGENFTGTLSEACLRPIRTPEQIAAEDLEKIIGVCGPSEAARRVLAAGYRKFEIVEGE